MASYVISDIHGEYDMFMELLRLIDFSDADTLYILGDVVDRGPHPIAVLQKLMKMPNVIPIVGNHEVMALDGLQEVMSGKKDILVCANNPETLGNIISWQMNGCESTITEFNKLNAEEQRDIIRFLRSFSLYEEVMCGDKKYLLIHAGLGGFRPDKAINEYSLFELVWTRPNYDLSYYADKYVVTGHTPTQFIEGNTAPGYIYKHNKHIAIDCGVGIEGGRLSALRLDDGECFYAEKSKYKLP